MPADDGSESGEGYSASYAVVSTHDRQQLTCEAAKLDLGSEVALLQYSLPLVLVLGIGILVLGIGLLVSVEANIIGYWVACLVLF